jgi:hypothetical protein
MEASSSSETLATTSNTARHHDSEDHNLIVHPVKTSNLVRRLCLRAEIQIRKIFQVVTAVLRTRQVSVLLQVLLPDYSQFICIVISCLRMPVTFLSLRLQSLQNLALDITEKLRDIYPECHIHFNNTEIAIPSAIYILTILR